MGCLKWHQIKGLITLTGDYTQLFTLYCVICEQKLRRYVQHWNSIKNQKILKQLHPEQKTNIVSDKSTVNAVQSHSQICYVNSLKIYELGPSHTSNRVTTYITIKDHLIMLCLCRR